jgi:GxxExxY protein
MPVVYKGCSLDCDLRIDIVVEQTLVLRIKAVHTLHPVHEAQLLTYLKISGLRVGLLVNFNAVRLVDGVRRGLL